MQGSVNLYLSTLISITIVGSLGYTRNTYLVIRTVQVYITVSSTVRWTAQLCGDGDGMHNRSSLVSCN